MDLGIKNKVALVTGAASEKGIGYAIACALAKEGADVVVTDIISEGVQSLARKIKDMGRRSLALQVDQGKYEDVKEAVEKINEEFDGIHILVNSAAITSNFGTLKKMKPEKFTNEININLNGPYFWIREVMPVMIKNNWGRILNISSIASLAGAVGMPSYATSKGGLLTLTKVAAREGASKGITANALVLGLVATEIYEKGTDPKVVEGMVKRVLLGRMASPEEVADIAAFLCSEKSSYITGENILVEGGLTINV